MNLQYILSRISIVHVYSHMHIDIRVMVYAFWITEVESCSYKCIPHVQYINLHLHLPKKKKVGLDVIQPPLHVQDVLWQIPGLSNRKTGTAYTLYLIHKTVAVRWRPYPKGEYTCTTYWKFNRRGCTIPYKKKCYITKVSWYTMMILCDQCCIIKLRSNFGDYTITIKL